MSATISTPSPLSASWSACSTAYSSNSGQQPVRRPVDRVISRKAAFTSGIQDVLHQHHHDLHVRTPSNSRPKPPSASAENTLLTSNFRRCRGASNRSAQCRRQTQIQNSEGATSDMSPTPAILPPRGLVPAGCPLARRRCPLRPLGAACQPSRAGVDRGRQADQPRPASRP